MACQGKSRGPLNTSSLFSSAVWWRSEEGGTGEPISERPEQQGPRQEVCWGNPTGLLEKGSQAGARCQGVFTGHQTTLSGKGPAGNNWHLQVRIIPESSVYPYDRAVEVGTMGWYRRKAAGGTVATPHPRFSPPSPAAASMKRPVQVPSHWACCLAHGLR